MSRILIIEDEEAIADLEKDYLNSVDLKLRSAIKVMRDYREPCPRNST